MRCKPAQHYNQAIDSTATRTCGFPAGILSLLSLGAVLGYLAKTREGIEHAYLEMDDHGFAC